MDNIIFLLAGLGIGLLVGVIIMGLCAASGRNSEKQEEYHHMNLAELLTYIRYFEKLYIYAGNVYDQNVPLVEGEEREYIDYEETDLLYHMNDKISSIRPVSGGGLEIIIYNEHYKERLETQYDAKYVAKWDALDPQTRPYKYTVELPSSGVTK